ncbi:molybdopterin molybdotransferase MoeA [Streptomyces sp. NPDC014805]|uniref:molybdopterin molybdotransferase MoeA n=1 Tax=Streptomyces sp. NPDC014805 TaxID=3364919 RepID=UPI0036FDE051
MTARGIRDEPDADDLDVEEALALVKDQPHPGRAGEHVPAPATGADSPDDQYTGDRHKGDRHGGTDRRSDGRNGGTDWRSDGRNGGADAPGDSGRSGRETRHARHKATPWPEARAIAARAGRARAGRDTTVSVSLTDALGLSLAAPLTALTDLPSFDTSAMDGWAVAGPGPWDVRETGVLAGNAEPEPLSDGEAVRIATGARVPADTSAVLRSEHGRTDDKDRLHATREIVPGQDIRPRGQECRKGDQLLAAGALVTPAVLGLAAAAGYDTLTAVRRPRVDLLVLGDELLTEGLPREGLIRDALGPLLPPWLRALGAEVTSVRRLGDDAEALYTAVTTSEADLIVTTGGTASGPVDHVHPTLRRIGAELLVDGVKVRPGHPMLLARLKEDQHLVGLPGNPLAAVSGLLTLAEPLLRALAAHPVPERYSLPLRDAVHGHPHDTRLVPVVLRGDHAVPLHYNGPAMLRGIAAADALAVVPPGGAAQGRETEMLDLPWATGGIGVCFT